jgi:methylated-DNA-[protein]-cysteine S-methyltransferase
VGVSPPAFALFDTPIGRCGAAWNERGLVWVQLPEADDEATRRKLLSKAPGATEQRPRGDAKRAVDAMRAHLSGQLTPMLDVAFDDARLPAFHRRVYDALRRVRPGETVGYGELAALAGSPGAARAVGQAVGKNPVPIVVPCHRVLAAGGKPGGFSAHGGVDTKRRMLEIEGVMLAPAKGGKRRKGLACDLDAAIAHLRQADPKLGAVIDRAVAPAMRLDPTESTFQALAQSIVYQQLSGKAAATIFGRLRDLFPRRKLTPQGLRDASDAALRGAGLSRGKTLALRDLAARTLAGTVPDIDRLRTMSDDAIVDRLVQVRGIGRWTVQMLLIFRLGRADVLPVDDYGVRAGFQHAYGKRKMPTPKELAKHGERWKPFRTVGAWYMWRALELSREKKSDGRG